MIKFISQIFHRKRQWQCSYNYIVDNFDSKYNRLNISYKNSSKNSSAKTAIIYLSEILIYIIFCVLIYFFLNELKLFNINPLFLIIPAGILFILCMFLFAIVFEPSSEVILKELGRQKKLKLITEEKYDFYINEILKAMESSKLSEEQITAVKKYIQNYL